METKVKESVKGVEIFPTKNLSGAYGLLSEAAKFGFVYELLAQEVGLKTILSLVVSALVSVKIPLFGACSMVIVYDP